MYTIKGKQKFGAVWENGKCLVEFHNGVATTPETGIADIMRAKGFTVEGGPEHIDPLAGLSVKELKKYAAENGIDLKKATKKDEILALIRAAAEDETADPDDEDEDQDDETDDEDQDEDSDDDSEDEDETGAGE